MELKWKQVPDGWAICFNNDCALHEQCLRWHAAQVSPSDLTKARCVTPHAISDGKCQLFASTQKVRYASGFSTIYKNVLKDDYTPLRKQMTMMLSGKRYYYEYMRGERLLSPWQQQQIRELFADRGYADNVVFDDFEDVFEFPRT